MKLIYVLRKIHFKQTKIIAVCPQLKQLRKKEARKKFRFEWDHDLCDTSAALLPTELSANWELVNCVYTSFIYPYHNAN